MQPKHLARLIYPSGLRAPEKSTADLVAGVLAELRAL
jgi:hypothetical protein